MSTLGLPGCFVWSREIELRPQIADYLDGFRACDVAAVHGESGISVLIGRLHDRDTLDRAPFGMPADLGHDEFGQLATGLLRFGHLRGALEPGSPEIRITPPSGLVISTMVSRRTKRV